MKVTVTFGRTGVVVPCRDGWTVRDLMQEATRRYRKTLHQDKDFLVQTHHLEYYDGGILDPDDVLTEVVEDKDKLIAMYEEREALRRDAASPADARETETPGPETRSCGRAELPTFRPIGGSEIEVTCSALMSDTPLLVRRSSDSALRPLADATGVRSTDPGSWPMSTGMSRPLAERGGQEDGRRDQSTPTASKAALSSLTRTVEISGEHGPLGIHVVPYFSSLNGRVLGLLIHGVEENSRCRREGIFQEDECIVRINKTPLMDKSFAQSQEVFRQAMRCPTVCLEVLPVASRERYEKGLIGQLVLPSQGGLPKIKAPVPVQGKFSRKCVDPAAKASESRLGQRLEGAASVAPPQIPLSATCKTSSALSPLAGFANKKGGKRLKINLKKGPEGLGFTVVTRDSPVHGSGPILVKNILPHGAAVKDGRLQPGDRILEVNGVDITSCTQDELVAMLRRTKQGDTVSLAVVRQEDVFLPRELQGDQAIARLTEGAEPLVLEIPLNDTGSAGLGVSLKGNKSRETGEDLGIFIKSIIHGGAAYKDGRLRVNDQLIAVNGESLLGRSNHEAMDTLRRSMSTEGNLRSTIQLLVMRAAEQQGKENHVTADSDHGTTRRGGNRRLGDPVQPPMVTNSIYETSGALRAAPPLRRQELVEEEEDDEYAPPLPPRLEDGVENASQSPERNTDSNPGQPPHPACFPAGRPELRPAKSSRSMDLVSDESNVGALAAHWGPKGSRGQESEEPLTKDLGATLGLKKSSSLESLQTAVLEMRKAQTPFYKPRPHMVRGRGCNESFRAAIDKSYDGPPGIDDDDLSDRSSGQGTPGSGSSGQGVGDVDHGAKDEKRKLEGKKKDKSKGKGKDGDRRETGDGKEQDKKARKRGFRLLRFGRNKEEKDKVEAKQKLGELGEEELDIIKEEKERTAVRHRDPDGLILTNLEDDDLDPNYARIDNFRNPPSITPHPYSGESDVSPHPVPVPTLAEEHADGLYSMVNKQGPTVATSSPDRIRQLRRERQQVRPEGAAPTHEGPEARSLAEDHDPQRVPAGGYDAQPVSRNENVERQYASLPRQSDPRDYLLQSWGNQGDAAHVSGSLSACLSYSPRDDRQPREPEQRPLQLRHGDFGKRPPPTQQRGPLRQDVPPSPPMPLRSTRYESMNRGRLERFPHREEQQQDPREKKPMTAAV